jgi:hypothetical protein
LPKAAGGQQSAALGVICRGLLDRPLAEELTVLYTLVDGSGVLLIGFAAQPPASKWRVYCRTETSSVVD